MSIGGDGVERRDGMMEEAPESRRMGGRLACRVVSGLGSASAEGD